MKILITVLLILTAFTQATEARMIKRLDCQSEPGKGFTAIAIDDIYQGFARIMYNYSAATLICSNYLVSRLIDGGESTCHGTWAFDWQRGRGSQPEFLDTIALLKLKSANGKITAETRTNVIYGSRKLILNCELKEVQGE
ncbi:MAG: hypothetical protein H7061_10395 [Bdellovibrionaceae bacterium]|nr:hypothetical protein [Bdellovibrio sp.]